LEHLYESTYSDSTRKKRSQQGLNTNFGFGHLATHLQVYILADRWDLTSLQQEALSTYKSGIKRDPVTFDFVDSLRAIFDEDEGFPSDSIGEEVRALVLRTVSKNYFKLIGLASFRQLAVERGNIIGKIMEMQYKRRTDVTAGNTKQGTEQRELSCPHCLASPK
jgi:hypothetical protein